MKFSSFNLTILEITGLLINDVSVIQPIKHLLRKSKINDLTNRAFVSGDQCIEYNTDFIGHDISYGYSSGEQDCYNRCAVTPECKSVTMVYRGTVLDGKIRVNHCWLKSKRFAADTATNHGNLLSFNMDCFIGMYYSNPIFR